MLKCVHAHFHLKMTVILDCIYMYDKRKSSSTYMYSVHEVYMYMYVSAE